MAVMAYRTRDGLADYGFAIDYQPSVGWRVYIVFQPVRQVEDGGLTLPYQAIDSDGRRYVNWPEKLDNLGDAKVVAELWAEMIQNYRRDQERRELIECYQRSQERRRATPAGPDRLGDAVADSGEVSHGHQDHSTVIPHQRSAPESFSELRESA